MQGHEYEPLVDLKSAKEIAREIFEQYRPQHGAPIGEDGVKDMMRDAYQTINKSFEPSKGDVNSYFEVLGTQQEGQVSYEDIEKHVIRFLIGEDVSEQPQPNLVEQVEVVQRVSVAVQVFRVKDEGSLGQLSKVLLPGLILEALG